MVITQTPLRISIAGGGTDFRNYYVREGGAVLSLTIDKYVYVIVQERFDEKVYVNYSQKEIVDDFAEVKHELVREAMRKAAVRQGVEITTLADVPSEGTGLGSSSSITVGLLNALYAYQGTQVTAAQLAEEACEIEIDIVGKPIGVQDQYIAAYGGLRFLEFRRDGTVRVERIELAQSRMRRFVFNLMLFYTGRTRDGSAILAEQQRNIGDHMPELGRLRDLAYEAREHLQNDSMDAIGELLDQAWMEKQKLARGIGHPEVTRIYARGREAGALGGKLCGAGGGGFILLYCPMEYQNQVREALQDLRELPFLFERDGSKVVFSTRRYPWK